MQLTDFYSTAPNGTVKIAPEQASTFAKSVAGDFNPIHNPDNKRFCVPGDLLFSLVLNQYGLSTKMLFTFKGMVGANASLLFNEDDPEQLSVEDEKGKTYLYVKREGENSQDAALIKELACGYVSFSGQTFPHILVPLMQENGVMINPERPLVIYENMAIDLNTLDIEKPRLVMSNATLDVNGKRGNVSLEFNIESNGTSVGTGRKNLVISGLRPYESGALDTLIDDYQALKQAYVG
ncbi:MAG: DUF3581 domain-containing protein [bacterium]